MEKNTEHKKAKDEETLSDQEIRWTIRYLDPDIKDKAPDGGVIITGPFRHSVRSCCCALQSQIVRSSQSNRSTRPWLRTGPGTQISSRSVMYQWMR